MSRTVKGAKGPGYEYWSRRPPYTVGGTPGRASKTVTHRLERAASKRELQELRGAK
jgi:hypothetical protein